MTDNTFLIDKVLLPFLFGALGFSALWLCSRILTSPGFRRRFSRRNEQLVEAIQRLVRAKNDVLLIELEVAELTEALEPEERQRWARDAVALAASVPPPVMAQIRRFGLAEPPPDDVRERARNAWANWDEEELKAELEAARELSPAAALTVTRSAWNTRNDGG